MLPLQYSLPAEENIEKCIITKEFIEEKEEVTLEYSKPQTKRTTKKKAQSNG